MENIDSTYLARLQDYYAEAGVLPPYSTIMGIVGLKSKSPVAALVARLKLQGYLESTPEKRLKPGRRVFEPPIFDSVRAGFPSPAGDANHDMLTIDEYLVLVIIPNSFKGFWLDFELQQRLCLDICFGENRLPASCRSLLFASVWY